MTTSFHCLFPSIVVFLLGAEGYQCEDKLTQSIVAEVVQRVEATHFQGHLCSILIVDNALKNLSELGTRGIFRVQGKSLHTQASNRFREVLAQQSSCIIAIIAQDPGGHSVSLASYLINLVGRSFIITYGRKVPALVKRHPVKEKFIFHAEVNTRRKTGRGYAFCIRKGAPREFYNASTQLAPVQIESWVSHEKDGPRSLVKTWNLSDVCTSHLQGKIIKLSYTGYHPHFAWKYDASGDPIGSDISVAKLLAQKFDFTPHFVLVNLVEYDGRSSALEGSTFDLVGNGVVTMGIGPLPSRHENPEHLYDSTPLLRFDPYWVTRRPLTIRALHNILRIFSPIVWILMFGVLFSLSLTFVLTHFVYHRLLPSSLGLSTGNILWMDFVIFPISRFMEPDALPWFPKWSVGKFTTLLWSIFSMVMVFFFLSNFRARLISLSLERPLQSIEDIAASEHKLYAHRSVKLNIDENVPEMRTILSRIDSNNHFYESLDFPSHIAHEVLTEGAIVILPGHFIPFAYLTHEDFLPMNLQMVPNPTMKWWLSYKFLKGQPWIDDVNKALRVLVDMGIVQHVSEELLPLKATLRTQQSQHADDDNLKPLNMDHLEAPMYVLAFGLCLSTLVFVGETQSERRKPRVIVSPGTVTPS